MKLTPAQQAVVKDLDSKGRADMRWTNSSADYGHRGDVLQRVVDAGLAEWDPEKKYRGVVTPSVATKIRERLAREAAWQAQLAAWSMTPAYGLPDSYRVHETCGSVVLAARAPQHMAVLHPTQES